MKTKFWRIELAVAVMLLTVGGAPHPSFGAEPQVIVWSGPGGDVDASRDYEVTVRSGDKSWHPFTYHSYNRPVDKLVDAAGNYIKLSFLALHSNEFKRPEDNRDTYAHSWTSFDFAGGPVEVEVKVKRPLDGLTLPLRSCGIFPSTLGIKCQVVGANTIRFTLSKPAKIAVVPNHLQALEKLQRAEQKQAFEGYRNPLFLFARAPEVDVPDKSAPGTLVVNPGRLCSVEEFAKSKVIYFEPGVHDYSQFNSADPDHYLVLRTGQTLYMAGGAYVHGVVSADKRRPAISESDGPRAGNSVWREAAMGRRAVCDHGGKRRADGGNPDHRSSQPHQPFHRSHQGRGRGRRLAWEHGRFHARSAGIGALPGLAC